MEDEAHGDDLGAHLHREDAHEDRLELLQLQRQDGLVVARYPGVHGHDHAVAHDGDDDQPLEGRPCHEPDKQPPETQQHLGSKVLGSVIKVEHCTISNYVTAARANACHS